MTFNNSRVVGPGTDSEFDGGPQGGKLLNAKAYYQNGVLAKQATESTPALSHRA
jgi:hypothetical protein